MRILGPPEVSYDVIHAGAAREGATELFLDEMLPALWAAAIKYSVRPEGVVAQAYHETGGGRYTRLVPPFFYNTAGLKLRHPSAQLGTIGEVTLAHAQFIDWRHGAEAHVQHLLAYAGCLDMTGASYLVVDPRAWIVVAKGYRAETFEELSGKWAVPGEGYGESLVRLAERMMEEA